MIYSPADPETYFVDEPFDKWVGLMILLLVGLILLLTALAVAYHAIWW